MYQLSSLSSRPDETSRHGDFLGAEARSPRLPLLSRLCQGAWTPRPCAQARSAGLELAFRSSHSESPSPSGRFSHAFPVRSVSGAGGTRSSAFGLLSVFGPSSYEPLPCRTGFRPAGSGRLSSSQWVRRAGKPVAPAAWKGCPTRFMAAMRDRHTVGTTNNRLWYSLDMDTTDCGPSIQPSAQAKIQGTTPSASAAMAPTRVEVHSANSERTPT